MEGFEVMKIYLEEFGFINNEDWKMWIKQKQFHSVGPGIMIFDTSNLEVIGKEDNRTFVKEHNIDIKNVLEEVTY